MRVLLDRAFSLGRIGAICQEEGQDPSAMHILQEVEYGYYQE